jgi:hypothetical protein
MVKMRILYCPSEMPFALCYIHIWGLGAANVGEIAVLMVHSFKRKNYLDILDLRYSIRFISIWIRRDVFPKLFVG